MLQGVPTLKQILPRRVRTPCDNWANKTRFRGNRDLPLSISGGRTLLSALIETRLDKQVGPHLAQSLTQRKQGLGILPDEKGRRINSPVPELNDNALTA